MGKELKELIELGQKYPELDKEELIRYVHLQSVIETKLKRLENYEQNEDFNKDVLNYAFLNEQDKIKKLKALEAIKQYANLVIAVMSNCKGGETYDLLKEVLL
jgi:hypothetical protein